ncbi:FAD binding domain-containing protein [Ophiobolus disseminans]|uniref:FAD binding domain-containing protein n=1 Tax=Ophiobolus disseminans TaxID=1469910 RepID=A0A6A6ZN07_9PLEO|nr:FAD binding domain-containing protein [Ophiobolus disseminans]
MKLTDVVSLSVVAVAIHASTFEPTDFNVTEALIDSGVNVSAIPELAGLVERSSIGACSIACNVLKLTFGADSVLSEGSSAYDSFTGAYWAAQQANVNPFCVFKPSSATQVSAAVLLSRLTQCPFAVKGGGHAAFAGGSSIEGGITIALEKLNEVTLSSNKKIAAVGPGNRWIRVYETLEQDGLAVIGGRVATVGVSGLTLGGGISHFANAYGWACDNVESYEVVTASGVIVTANVTAFPDLYSALRGGGNNFGIVTKFNMRTFALGPMWGGPRVYLPSEWDQVYTVYAKIARNAAQDTKQAQIVSFALQNGIQLAAADLEYSEPTPWPAIFADWKAIPAAQDLTAITNLTTVTRNLGAGIPEGIQETYWDYTYKLDRDLMKFSIDTFFGLMPAIADAPDLLPVLSFQAITVPAMEKMQQNGGNALGLDPKDGPVYICNLAIMWTNAADNDRIHKFSNTLYQRINAEAAKKGLTNDYIYMNYASPWQDVISSYGAANKQRLKKIAAVYDPTAVFQRLQPGYFKLEGAPYGPFPA